MKAKIINDTDHSGNTWLFIMDKVGQILPVISFTDKDYLVILRQENSRIAVPKECVEILV